MKFEACLIVLSASLPAACTAGDADEGITVRDSAGVVIVESRRPAWEGGHPWSVGARPLQQVGVVDGPPEYQFTEIAGAVRLDDGRIVVADGGSREIRFFDTAGQFITSTGRSGDAPGEYRLINTIGAGAADSVWVYDYRARRFTVLTGDGELARTFNIGPELANVGAVGRLGAGEFVLSEYWSAGVHAGLEAGLSRDPVAVARYSADEGRLDTIGLFPGREIFIGSEDGRAVMSSPLFAHHTSAAVRGHEVFVGDQERFEVGLYSAAGELLRLIRLPEVDLQLGEEDIQQATQARLAGLPEAHRAAMRAQLEALDVPETRPAYSHLLTDAEGNLWVAEYVAAPRAPQAWHVFDPHGAYCGVVRVPERFRVWDIGSDWILGSWRDEIDVEYVRLYAILKSES